MGFYIDNLKSKRLNKDPMMDLNSIFVGLHKQWDNSSIGLTTIIQVGEFDITLDDLLIYFIPNFLDKPQSIRKYYEDLYEFIRTSIINVYRDYENLPGSSLVDHDVNDPLPVSIYDTFKARVGDKTPIYATIRQIYLDHFNPDVGLSLADIRAKLFIHGLLRAKEEIESFV